jgi:hypothetical protein
VDWTVSQETKCKGITLFVLAVGPGVGAQELGELACVASGPPEQHLLYLESISEPEVAYARGFTRSFLNLLQSKHPSSSGVPWVGRAKELTEPVLGQVDVPGWSLWLKCMYPGGEPQGAPHVLKTLHTHGCDIVSSLGCHLVLSLSLVAGKPRLPSDLSTFSFTKMTTVVFSLIRKPGDTRALPALLCTNRK